MENVWKASQLFTICQLFAIFFNQISHKTLYAMSYNNFYRIGCGHPKWGIFNIVCTLVSFVVFLKVMMPGTFP